MPASSSLSEGSRLESRLRLLTTRQLRAVCAAEAVSWTASDCVAASVVLHAVKDEFQLRPLLTDKRMAGYKRSNSNGARICALTAWLLTVLLGCSEPGGELLLQKALHIYAAGLGHGLHVWIVHACCQLRLRGLPTCSDRHWIITVTQSGCWLGEANTKGASPPCHPPSRRSRTVRLTAFGSS